MIQGPYFIQCYLSELNYHLIFLTTPEDLNKFRLESINYISNRVHLAWFRGDKKSVSILCIRCGLNVRAVEKWVKNHKKSRATKRKWNAIDAIVYLTSDMHSWQCYLHMRSTNETRIRGEEKKQPYKVKKWDKDFKIRAKTSGQFCLKIGRPWLGPHMFFRHAQERCIRGRGRAGPGFTKRQRLVQNYFFKLIFKKLLHIWIRYIFRLPYRITHPLIWNTHVTIRSLKQQKTHR